MTTLRRRSFLAGSLALAGAAALPAIRPARAAAADLDFASALDAALGDPRGPGLLGRADLPHAGAHRAATIRR